MVYDVRYVIHETWYEVYGMRTVLVCEYVTPDMVYILHTVCDLWYMVRMMWYTVLICEYGIHGIRYVTYGTWKMVRSAWYTVLVCE